MFNFLGYENINNKKYQWNVKNPLKNKKWKDAIDYKNNNYFYNKVSIIEENNNIIIKFTPIRNIKLKLLFLVIFDFKNNNPRNIFNDIYGLRQKDSNINSLYPLGAHFEDAILDFYHNKNLDFGYVQKILK